ncbi:hypothetical protein [Geodermatophilus chilensis]|uniref:hypothetical protein n=1 Tax=Geodermatophilus chilensis TaxID=2035835 RepID=UPI0012FFE71D|nr:hypothetical protein [Geodermatophilus chilensis]
MRRGRALLPHPEPQYDDTGRTVVTRQLIVFTTGAHISWVRRNLQPVACHTGTRAPLYDVDDAKIKLATRAQRAT